MERIMNKTLLPIVLLTAAVALAALVGSTGCVNVKAPDRINIGGDEVYAKPPSSDIPPADPNSTTDLRRENKQLRERNAWLEKQNRKLGKKINDLEEDKDKLRDEIDDLKHQCKKMKKERDRYKKALEDDD